MLGKMKFIHFFSKRRLKDWFVQNAETKRAKWVLALVAYFESIFFPIPPDFFLMAILATNKGKRWAYYSTITTVAAVLGGITSYFIGYLFFDALGQKIIDLYSLQDDFATVKTIFQNNAFLAVFVSTFTPLPDKVFNLAAGLFKINIPTFIFAYILGRASRFFAVGFVMKIFGARVARAVYRHLNMFSIIAIVVVGLAIFLISKF